MQHKNIDMKSVFIHNNPKSIYFCSLLVVISYYNELHFLMNAFVSQVKLQNIEEF